MPFEVFTKHEGQSVDALVETVLEELGKVGQETAVASMVVGADLTVGGTISAPANALSADVVADSATRKWLTTGTQSIAGNKTISGSLTVGGTTTINDNDLAHTASSGDVRYTMSNTGKSLELKLFEAGDANFNFSDASKSMYFRAGGASTISYSSVDIKLWKDVTLKKGGNAWPGVPLTFLSGGMETVIGGDGTSESDPTAADLKIDNVSGGAINLKSNGTTVAEVTGTGLNVMSNFKVNINGDDIITVSPYIVFFNSQSGTGNTTYAFGPDTHIITYGAFGKESRTVTYSQTLTTNDSVIICNSTSAIDLTLPIANKREIIIKNINTGTVRFRANVSGSIAEHVDATQHPNYYPTSLSRWDSVYLFCDTNNWYIVSIF
jgi:hypothetical protein